MDLKQEQDLIAKIKTDSSAFEVLYEYNYSKIFNYTLRRTVNIELAQDITSEVFIKAFNKLWLFKWRNISFTAWLYRIATNEISSYFRKNKTSSISLDKLLEENGFEPADLMTPATELIEAQQLVNKQGEFLNLQNLISKLPSKYQNVISLRFFENKKIKEIAEILNKSEGTIKSLLSRAVQKLKMQRNSINSINITDLN